MLAVAVAAAPARADPARRAAGGPAYRDDRLTLHVRDRRAADVLADVAAAAGATVQGRPAVTTPVSADIDGERLADALHRLLGGQAFTVVYRRDGGVRTIRLYGGPAADASEAPAPPPPAVVKKHTPTPNVTPANVVATLDHHPPVAVPSALRAAVGGSPATFRRLFQAAAHAGDPAVRAEAARVLVETIESDPSLRSYVANATVALDDDALADVARGAAGDGAGDLLRLLASRTTDRELRAKVEAAARWLDVRATGG